MATVLDRPIAIRAGIRIEQVTVAWMAVEAVVGIGAGIAASSVVLTAFGLDSVIELLSGGVLLWRLLLEAGGGDVERVDRAERRATVVTAVALSLLCVYILAISLFGLATGHRAEQSSVGIALACVAVIGMPLLARTKRGIAAAIGSQALRADAACSITCAYMAGTLLVGLLANTLFGLWWADSVAALVLLVWLGRETLEAWQGVRNGTAACTCDD